MSTLIYGASDDLIEVEGDIDEEFDDVDFGGGAYVYTSAGHIIRFRLEDEGWRATIVVDPGGAATPEVTTRPDHDGDEAVNIRTPLTWVVATTTAAARP